MSLNDLCLSCNQQIVTRSTRREVKKMKDEKSVVNITVNIAGVQEANQLVERLCEKIKEAKTLACDLTSLVESLEVTISEKEG